MPAQEKSLLLLSGEMFLAHIILLRVDCGNILPLKRLMLNSKLKSLVVKAPC